MRNTFTFGSVASGSYGVYISGSGTYNSPERVISLIDVPGRNGALLGNEKRFENIEVTYPAFIFSSFDSNLSGLRSALQSITGYARLTDTYHTDEYRLGVFIGGFDVDTTAALNAGKFNVTFNCKPQRFLTSGETETTLTADGTITNPTKFPSKPKITVTGYGTLTVGSQTITITNAYPSIVIDSDLCDCYSGAYNANGQVEFSNNDFPELVPGSNAITMSGNITSVKILPRWWRI